MKALDLCHGTIQLYEQLYGELNSLKLQLSSEQYYKDESGVMTSSPAATGKTHLA